MLSPETVRIRSIVAPESRRSGKGRCYITEQPELILQGFLTISWHVPKIPSPLCPHYMQIIRWNLMI